MRRVFLIAQSPVILIQCDSIWGFLKHLLINISIMQISTLTEKAIQVVP